MSNSADDEAIRIVAARIDRALRMNVRHEITLVVLLSLLFLVGLSLIIFGALEKQWVVFGFGGLLQTSLLYPLRLLIRLRAGNIALQILPQMMALAKTQEMKALTAKLVARLIDQV